MAKKYEDYNPYRPNGTSKQRFVEALVSKEDIQKTLEHLKAKDNKRNLCMFCVALNFALRLNDLVNLKWSYVLDENYNIKSTIWLQESKRRRIRELTMNDLTREAIIMYIQSLKDKGHEIILNNHMFPSRKGYNKPLLVSNASTLFKKIFKDAGCNPDYNYAGHTMRKSSGKLLYDAGNDVWKISSFLGHRNEQQTMCYIGITRRDVRDMYKSLDDGLHL